MSIIHFLKTHIEFINKLVITYTGVFIVYHYLTILTPIYELFEQPGWNITPKLIGLAGGVLLAADLFTTRTVLRIPHVKWVLLLIITLIISSVVRYQYLSVFESVKYIVYISVQNLLVFSAGVRMNREGRKRFLKLLHMLISIVFVPALCYMFWQFFTQQHYLNLDFVDQGWHDGRLFGIMYILYDGALAVSILAFGTAYLLICSNKMLHRALYAAELIICIIYIALSGCRTAYVACAAGLGCFILYRYCCEYRADGADSNKRYIPAAKWLLIYMAVLLILYAGITGIRNAGFYVIWNMEKSRIATEETYDESRQDLDRHQQYTVSSGRTEIWKNYIDIMTDKPSHLIFGLSYNGHSQYIREYYQDYFIITYFKEHYPASYQKGNVYDAHNSYLFTLVTAGAFGLLALLIFIILNAYDVLNSQFRGKLTAFDCLLEVMIMMLLSAAVFEHNVFISVSAVAACFWMIEGMLLSNIGLRENDV